MKPVLLLNLYSISIVRQQVRCVVPDSANLNDSQFLTFPGKLDTHKHPYFEELIWRCNARFLARQDGSIAD